MLCRSLQRYLFVWKQVIVKLRHFIFFGIMISSLSELAARAASCRSLPASPGPGRIDWIELNGVSCVWNYGDWISGVGVPAEWSEWWAWLRSLGARSNARELGDVAVRCGVVERLSGQIAIRGAHRCERHGRLNG